LLLALLFSLFVRISSAGNDTTFFGYKPLHIVSGSMETDIRTGSIILSKRADFSALRVGDIVSYDNGQELITHRVVAVNPDGSLRAKGDANTRADETAITAENVKFVLVATMNWTAPVAAALHGPAGMVLILLLLADVVQFCVIMLLVKRRRQRATEPEPAGEESDLWQSRAERDQARVDLYLRQLDEMDPDELERFFLDE